MKLTLIVSCDHNALAAILAGCNAGRSTIHEMNLGAEFDDLGAVTSALVHINGNTAGNAASTNTGAGTPAPMPLPSAPGGAVLTPIAPMPSMSNVSTDADEGDDSVPGGDGSGVDADGLPWDERIHSSNKLKSANGKWQSRRGGPKGDERAAIEAELRGAGAPTPPAPMPVPMPLSVPHVEPAPEPLAPPAAVQPPPLPVPAPIAAPAPAPQPMPAPAPAPMPVAEVQPAPAPLPTPAAAAPAPSEWDFASFMHAVGPKMGEGAGMIDPTYLTAVCAHYGLNAITDLAPKPEMIGQIVAQFTADGRW